MNKTVVLKACWEVHAGLHSSHVIEGTAKKWFYTSEHFEADINRPDDEETTFCKFRKEATEYAQSLQDPAKINYVRFEFLWL